MKPDWDKLMGVYEGSESVLIGDVDCTAAGKSKCQEVGIGGYPTIKYGDPSDLEDYSGPRDYDGLKAFADGLGPVCGLSNIHLCDPDKQALIKEYQALSSDERQKKIKRLENEIAEAESDFEDWVAGLQKSYDENVAKKDKRIAAIKDSGLSLLKSIDKAADAAKTEL